jgi:ferrochelatase
MSSDRSALLVLSFGGPEGPADVVPFLRNVTRGRDVPDDRLTEVAEQYARFGGCSPLNDQCRALIAAVTDRLAGMEWDLPVYWGNRNWHPFLVDTVAAMADDGVTDAVVFATSAFGSYSGCRQYREDLERAAAEVGPRAPTLTKLRLYYNHPGFIDAQADRLRAALTIATATTTAAGTGAETGAEAEPDGTDPACGRLPEGTRLVFTAHSIPVSMASGCDYVAQLREAARLVTAASGLCSGGGDPIDHDLVYQSRSGPPTVPWLEPDVNDHLAAVAADGIDRVVLVPIGFTSDHMEVQFDLDTQAWATAERLGVELIRVPTVGTHPRFIELVTDLAAEQLLEGPRLAIGSDGPWPDQCPVGHCPPPARRPS